MIAGWAFAEVWLPIFEQRRCSSGWAVTSCRLFRPQYPGSSKRSDDGRFRNAAILPQGLLPFRARPMSGNWFREKFNERLG